MDIEFKQKDFGTLIFKFVTVVQKNVLIRNLYIKDFLFWYFNILEKMYIVYYQICKKIKKEICMRGFSFKIPVLISDEHGKCLLS